MLLLQGYTASIYPILGPDHSEVHNLTNLTGINKPQVHISLRFSKEVFNSIFAHSLVKASSDTPEGGY